MNYIQHKRNALLAGLKKEQGVPVLSTDFTLQGVTTFVYEEGMTTCNYLYPRKINGLGEDGILSFTTDNVTISFPVDKPLYGNSNLYDTFCYKNGKWGIERKIIVHIYDGTESSWIKSASCTFAVDNPDGLYKPSSDSNYIWAVSNITSTYRSYNATYKYDNCIGAGLTKTALRLTADVADLETFHTVMTNLNESGNSLKMLRRLESAIWEPLPDSIQNYLAKYQIV